MTWLIGLGIVVGVAWFVAIILLAVWIGRWIKGSIDE